MLVPILQRNYMILWAVGAAGITIGTLVNNMAITKKAEAHYIQEQNQELQKLQKIQKRFIQITAHDLRTPLTSVKGYLELIKTGVVPFESDEYWSFISTIEKCVTRVEDLTEKLLESQRLENEAMKLELTIVPLNDFIGEIASEIKPIVVERGQELDVKSSVNETMVEMDKLRMTQVMINLLGNASKYSPKNSVITLTVEEKGDNIMFMVLDHGIGLSDEDIPKLFEPFPEIEVEGNYDRTGLGLSISKGMVDLHKGQIGVSSEGRDKGSMFWVRIPIMQNQ